MHAIEIMDAAVTAGSTEPARLNGFATAATRAGDARSPAAVLDVGRADAGDLIGQVVSEIAAMQRRHGLRFMLELGGLLVERFYGGDVERFRRRGLKNASLRRLAKRPELPLSAATLYHSLGIYELTRRIDVSTCKRLTHSHLRAVLPLPASEQEPMLFAAEADGWTVAQLQARTAERLSAAPPRGGRPRLPRVMKTVRALRRCLDTDELRSRETDDVERIGAESRRQLVRELSEVIEWCRRTRQEITRPDGVSPE